jgi:hypothetical protein
MQQYDIVCAMERKHAILFRQRQYRLALENIKTEEPNFLSEAGQSDCWYPFLN